MRRIRRLPPLKGGSGLFQRKANRHLHPDFPDFAFVLTRPKTISACRRDRCLKEKFCAADHFHLLNPAVLTNQDTHIYDTLEFIFLGGFGVFWKRPEDELGFVFDL